MRREVAGVECQVIHGRAVTLVDRDPELEARVGRHREHLSVGTRACERESVVVRGARVGRAVADGADPHRMAIGADRGEPLLGIGRPEAHHPIGCLHLEVIGAGGVV